jgi:signal transduction histidine kinase
MSIFVILSVGYLKRQKNLDENIQKFEHSNAVLLAVEQINGILNANGSVLRTMLIMQDKKLLPDVLVGNIKLLEKVDQLIRLTTDDEMQRKKAVRMKEVLDHRFALIRDALPVYSSNQENITRFMLDLNALRNEYDSLYGSFVRTENRSVLLIRQSRGRFDKLSNPALTGILIFASLLLLATFLYLILTLKKRIYFQKELQNKIRTLNQANRELENLSRVTSHHIQEPMRKIRNFSTLLDKRLGIMPPEEARQIIWKIEGNAGSLQTLAQNLVQYANLIQDPGKKEKLELEDVVNEVLYKLEDLIFETKAEIVLAPLPVVNGIASQLFILFQELLKNSISFTRPEQCPYIEISRVTDGDPEFITIAVSDRGQGFSNDFADRIFRIFEQLEPRSAPGKGIGLAMCSRIMLNHGGRIRAVGSPGEGATFYLDFPNEMNEVRPRSRRH